MQRQTDSVDHQTQSLEQQIQISTCQAEMLEVLSRSVASRIEQVDRNDEATVQYQTPDELNVETQALIALNL